MGTKTHLPGKDAALEDTIAKATALLRSQGFPVELVSWLNPVQNCWSVHLRSPECAPLYTNGKGASKLASKASAILEFVERLSTNLFFADYYLGKGTDDDFVFYPNEKWFPISNPGKIPTRAPDGTNLLNEKLRDFYNPDGELTPAQLLDNNSDNRSRGIAALPFERLDRPQTVYFPVSILNNIYASNGMAAGNTPTECRAQALSEIIERHVKNDVIAKGICLPDVPQTVIDRYPHIQRDIAELRGHGFPIKVKDASLGGRFPVACVILMNPENSGCYASFGANCRFGVALERTVTELLQGRALNQLNVFQPPSHDLEEVADSFNLESHFIDSGGLLSWRMFRDQPDFEFNDWDFDGTTAEEYDHLKNIVHDLGFDAYCAEYLHCGTYTCRIVVPGMSEIYPIDDMIWNNKSTGAALRPQLLKLEHMSTDELKEFYEKLDGPGLDDLQSISEVIGVIFAEDSPWHSLRIGELKTMVALAAGELEEAARWCHWCHSFEFVPAARRRLYRVIGVLIDFELSDEDPAAFQSSMNELFGEELVTTGRKILKRELAFFGLAFASSWEKISPAHAEILRVYERLRPLKIAGHP